MSISQLNHYCNLGCVAVLFIWLSATGCRPSFEARCVERFPSTHTTEVRVQQHTDTVIIPFSSIEYIDTTYCPPGLTDTLQIIKTVTRTLPADTIYRDYVCTDTVVLRQDAEMVTYLRGQNQSLQLQLVKAQSKTARWIFILGGALLVTLLLATYFAKR